MAAKAATDQVHQPPAKSPCLWPHLDDEIFHYPSFVPLFFISTFPFPFFVSSSFLLLFCPLLFPSFSFPFLHFSIFIFRSLSPSCSCPFFFPFPFLFLFFSSLPSVFSLFFPLPFLLLWWVDGVCEETAGKDIANARHNLSHGTAGFHLSPRKVRERGCFNMSSVKATILAAKVKWTDSRKTFVSATS